MFVEPSLIRPAQCIFELVYFAKPIERCVCAECACLPRRDRSAASPRGRLPMPIWSFPFRIVPRCASIGYSGLSGIPLGRGFTTSHYVGRSFIMPDQQQRDLTVKMKLNVIREAVSRQAVDRRRGLRGFAARRRAARWAPCGRPARRRSIFASPALPSAIPASSNRFSQPARVDRPQSIGRGDPRLPGSRFACLPLSGRDAGLRPSNGRRLLHGVFFREYPMPIPQPVGKHGLEKFPLSTCEVGAPGPRRSLGGKGPGISRYPEAQGKHVAAAIIKGRRHALGRFVDVARRNPAPAAGILSV